MFRANLLKKVKNEIRPSGTMAFDNNKEKESCKAMIQELFKKKWNVFIKEKYRNGEGTLKYIAAYIKGGAISPNRIIQFGKNFVRFKYKDYKNSKQGEKIKKGIMKLSINDFIQRLILHIPPSNSQIMRYYGLYSSNSIKKLNQCRKVLDQEKTKEIDCTEINDTEEKQCYCKICKSVMNTFIYDREDLKKYLHNIKTNTNLKNKLVEFL